MHAQLLWKKLEKKIHCENRQVKMIVLQYKMCIKHLIHFRTSYYIVISYSQVTVTI